MITYCFPKSTTLVDYLWRIYKILLSYKIVMFYLTEKKYLGNYDIFYRIEVSWICSLECFIFIRFVYWISIYISIAILYNLSKKRQIIKLKIINSIILDLLLFLNYWLFFFLLINEQLLNSLLTKGLIHKPVWHLYFHSQSNFFNFLFINIELFLWDFEYGFV